MPEKVKSFILNKGEVDEEYLSDLNKVFTNSEEKKEVNSDYYEIQPVSQSI